MANCEIRNNSIRIRVSCGYDSTGKQIIKSKTFKLPDNLTEKQRDKEICRLTVLFEEQVKSNQYLNGSMKLSDFVDRWLNEHAKQNLKVKTVDGYNQLLPTIKAEIGHIKLCDLRPMHINAMYKKITDRGNVKIEKRIVQLRNEIEELTEKGIRPKTIEKLKIQLAETEPRQISPNTVRAYHRLLSSILEKAVQWEMIASNPAKKSSPPKYKRKEAKYLEEDDAKYLLKLLDDEPIQFKTMTAMYLFSGLRRGELLGLWWDDVDFNKLVIRIKRNIEYVPGIGVYEDTPKTESSARTVRLPSLAFEYLKEYRRWQSEQMFYASDLWKESNIIFTNEYGGYLFPDTITNRFSDFIRRSDLPHITIHSLRHTYANILIYTGTELKTVSSRLGHANSTTTQNIYSHSFQSADERAVENLEKFFQSDEDCS